MSLFTQARNKIAAVVVRKIVGASIGASSIVTHQDEVLHIQSRDSDRTIKVHVYKPAAASQPMPVLVNFHGSGFVIPMHGSDDEFALRVVKDTQYAVLDVQYRLAPENPFPAAAHDAEDVIRYVLSKPEVYAQDSVAVSGFSAGGTLALGLSGLVFPRGTFKHVVVFYPPTDLASSPESKVAPDTSGKPLASWMTNIFNDCYCPAGVDRKQPLASPYYIKGKDFPDSMLLVTCACDNLAIETEELMERIKAVPGKNISHTRAESCDHAWDKSYEPGTKGESEKDRTYSLAVDFLNQK